MQSFTLLTVLRVDDRLGTVSSTASDLNTKFGRLEGRFDGMDMRLDDLKSDVRAVNDRLFALPAPREVAPDAGQPPPGPEGAGSARGAGSHSPEALSSVAQ